MRHCALLLVMLMVVSCAASIPTPMLTKPATLTRPLTDTPIATWPLSGGSDAEIVTNTVAFQQRQGHIYYVATNGDDSNPGTEARPFRTLNKGISVLGPGNTLYIREGIYHERVTVSASGTADEPITISAYPGEQPILDGESVASTERLLYLGGDYIVVKDLEVRNAPIRGVGLGGHDNEVRNLNVHHCYKSGILIGGQNNLAEGCTVWQNSQRHHVDGRTSGCLSATGATNAVIRGNTVYNNWGEAISSFKATGTTIEDNVVYDNLSVNIYVDNSPHTLIQRNLVYNTGGTDWSSSPGISLCDENYSSAPPPSVNVTIINNVVLGGNGCFYFGFHDVTKGLRGVLIAHNTFVNSDRKATLVIRAADHENTRIQNNAFVQENTLPLAIVPDDPGLTFSHNLWSKAPPAAASGLGDVIGDPRLARSGPTGPGLLNPDWFKLLFDSPAIDVGITLSEVPDDFDRASRPRGADYDIGAYESPFSTQVTDLRVVAAVGDMPNPTLTLRWTAPAAAVTYNLRSSDTLLTMANWSDAPTIAVPFTASEPGSSEWLTAPVDYAGGTLYLALKSQNSAGIWSGLSNNAFWPRMDVHLPLIGKDYVLSLQNSRLTLYLQRLGQNQTCQPKPSF